MEARANVWEIISAISGVAALIAYLYLERDKLDSIAIRRLKLGILFLAVGASYWLVGRHTYGNRFPLLDVVYALGPFHISRIANTAITILIVLGLGVTLGIKTSRVDWSAERKVGFLFVCGATLGSVLALVFIAQRRLPVSDWSGYTLIVFAAAVHTALGTVISALAVDRVIRWRQSRGSTSPGAAPTLTP